MAADKPYTYNRDELTIIITALERELDSAKRQQNIKGRTKMMEEVFKKHELTVTQLLNKVRDHQYQPQ